MRLCVKTRQLELQKACSSHLQQSVNVPCKQVVLHRFVSTEDHVLQTGAFRLSRQQRPALIAHPSCLTRHFDFALQ